MEWFGENPFAPACDDVPHVPTPVGEPCAWCEEPIVEGDAGYLVPHLGVDSYSLKPWHPECMTRSVIGGANHVHGSCTCCGGTRSPDPEGMSKRDAARLAVRSFTTRLADPERVAGKREQGN